MKMIITLKATESGKVTHEKQPGSIINQGDLLASLQLADPSKVKKILTFDGELPADKTEESTLTAFRASQKGLELVMDGYVLDSDELVQKMLAALSSVSLVVGEVNDAASMLGQKLPAELDAMLQKVYAETLAQHVDGADSKETEALCAKLSATIDEYVQAQLEAKREGIYATLAPISAVIDKFALGLRENAVTVVCALLSRYLAVETTFADAASTDQAIATLTKANPDALDAVYKAAFAHEQLAARSELCNNLLRQLSNFPERFGVAPLRDLPPALDVVTSLSQLPGSSYASLALTAAQFSLMMPRSPSTRPSRSSRPSSPRTASTRPRSRARWSPTRCSRSSATPRSARRRCSARSSAGTAPSTSSRSRRRRAAACPPSSSSTRPPTRRRRAPRCPSATARSRTCKTWPTSRPRSARSSTTSRAPARRRSTRSTSRSPPTCPPARAPRPSSSRRRSRRSPPTRPRSRPRASASSR